MSLLPEQILNELRKLGTGSNNKQHIAFQIVKKNEFFTDFSNKEHNLKLRLKTSFMQRTDKEIVFSAVITKTTPRIADAHYEADKEKFRNQIFNDKIQNTAVVSRHNKLTIPIQSYQNDINIVKNLLNSFDIKDDDEVSLLESEEVLVLNGTPYVMGMSRKTNDEVALEQESLNRMFKNVALDLDPLAKVTPNSGLADLKKNREKNRQEKATSPSPRHNPSPSPSPKPVTRKLAKRRAALPPADDKNEH